MTMGLFAAAAVFVAAVLIRESGVRSGTCAERWKYQQTPADTLTTIRGGCVLPGSE
jgi:hypothetical protein